MKKWFTPVGLYSHQMQALESLQAKLKSLGANDSDEMRALRDVLIYFGSDTNDAYLTMKELDAKAK